MTEPTEHHAHMHDHANDHAMADGVREDPPNPDLDQLQQRPPVIPAVAVALAGSAQVHILPAIRSAVTADTYVQDGNGQPDQILYNDPKRSKATLISTSDFFYLSNRTGTKAPWPKNVPLVVTHSDNAFVSGQTQAAQITCIMEFWAD